jgi:hypothetical protein
MGRCNHDPAAPRLELVVAIAPNLPKLNRDVIDRARDIYRHPNRFPELTAASIAGPRAKLRRRKSPRLEAIALTVAALGRRCDRRTLRVGDQRDDGRCNGVDRKKLCEHTGLSPSRLARALAELEGAAYIHSAQAVEEKTDADGQPILDLEGKKTYRGFPAVRVLTPLLFQRLGFRARKVAKARAHAYQEWTTRRAAPASAVAILSTRRELRKLAAAASPAPRGEAMPARYYELELAVKARHPDWGIERIRAEARRLLPR